MTRIEPGAGLVMYDRMVHGGDRLGGASSDQPKFRWVPANIARGKNTLDTGLHRDNIDHDLILLEFETPRFERTEVGQEPDSNDQFIGLDCGNRSVAVLEGHFTKPAVAGRLHLGNFTL